MKKIRIGKDINVNWRITTNGTPTPLTGRDLTLFIIDPIGHKERLTFTVSGNVMTATVRGVDQKIKGDYGLELWENLGKDGQTVVDMPQAFTLVSSTLEEE